MLLCQVVGKVERASTAGNHDAVLIIWANFLSEDLSARCIWTLVYWARHRQGSVQRPTRPKHPTADGGRQRTDRFRHPVVGPLEIDYESLHLPGDPEPDSLSCTGLPTATPPPLRHSSSSRAGRLRSDLAGEHCATPLTWWSTTNNAARLNRPSNKSIGARRTVRIRVTKVDHYAVGCSARLGRRMFRGRARSGSAGSPRRLGIAWRR